MACYGYNFNPGDVVRIDGVLDSGSSWRCMARVSATFRSAVDLPIGSIGMIIDTDSSRLITCNTVYVMFEGHVVEWHRKNLEQYTTVISDSA